MTESEILLARTQFEAIRDENIASANTATRIGEAFLKLLDLMANNRDPYIRRDIDDIAAGIITFYHGLRLGVEELYEIDGVGNARLNNIIANVLGSARFNSGPFGNGWRLWQLSDNGYKLEIDDLNVRRKMTVNTLEVRELDYEAGNFVFGPAGSVLVRVVAIDRNGNEYVIDTSEMSEAEAAKYDPLNDRYDIKAVVAYLQERGIQPYAFRCYCLTDNGTTATINAWKLGDQARCQQFDIGKSGSGDFSNKYYWRKVVGVGADYIDLSFEDRWHTVELDDDGFPVLEDGEEIVVSDSDFPSAGDKVCCMGNRNEDLIVQLDENGQPLRDEEDNVITLTPLLSGRCGFLYIETTGSDEVSITLYDGITSYELSKKNIVFRAANSGIILNSKSITWTSDGIEYAQLLYAGDWTRLYNNGRGYDYYKWVTHINCGWLCTAPPGTYTTEEPSENATYWKLIFGVPTSAVRKMRFVSEYGEYDTFVSYGDTVHFRAIVEDGLRNDHTSEYTGWQITRDTGNADEDGNWNVTRASIDDNGEFSLTWNSEHDDLGAERATFTITAQLRVDQNIVIEGQLVI